MFLIWSKPWYPEYENFRRQLGILYWGDYARKADGATDNHFYIAYNMHWESHTFDLPKPSEKTSVACGVSYG